MNLQFIFNEEIFQGRECLPISVFCFSCYTLQFLYYYPCFVINIKSIVFSLSKLVFSSLRYMSNSAEQASLDSYYSLAKQPAHLKLKSVRKTCTSDQVQRDASTPSKEISMLTRDGYVFDDHFSGLYNEIGTSINSSHIRLGTQQFGFFHLPQSSREICQIQEVIYYNYIAGVLCRLNKTEEGPKLSMQSWALTMQPLAGHLL